MSYKKAEAILPIEVIELIQKYVDGECIYIPKKDGNKLSWGSNTSTKKILKIRNANIYKDYLAGMKIKTLAEKYFLSKKSIERIVLQEKRDMLEQQ